MLSDRGAKQFQSHSLKEGSMRKKFDVLGNRCWQTLIKVTKTARKSIYHASLI